MRKGFSLIELIVIIAILPIVFLAADGLLASMLSDVPRSGKTIQENSTLLTMLRQMEQDVNAAKDLPASMDGYTAGDDLLLIEQADKVIHYERKNDTVYRYGSRDKQQIPQDLRYWYLPNAKIRWQVCRQNGRGYAVEIQYHIEYTQHGHLMKKMQNSSMFFTGTIEKTK